MNSKAYDPEDDFVSAVNQAIDYGELLKELRLAYCRENLIDFTRLTFNRYKPNWHHFLIADRLEMLSRGEINRLIINMPPRHGKSELVSNRFPAWFLGTNPNKSVIAASYNAKLAEKFGKQSRNVVASVEFRKVFPNARLSEESAAKLNWTLEATHINKPCPNCGDYNWYKKAFGRAICKTCGTLGEFAGTNTLGEYYGAGIGGGITGRGADVLIIDDPVKDRKEAESETFRRNIWDWYTSAALTRLEESNLLIICQTRWHENDLTGKVLSDGDENWEVLSLAAIPEEDKEFKIYNEDYIKRLGSDTVVHKKGTALWPDKYPLEKLENIRLKLGTYDWSALYQQNPQPIGGGLFKSTNFRYCTLDNGVYSLLQIDGSKRQYIQSHCTRFATMDLGYVDGVNNDYTVVCTWDITKDNDLILVDCFREHVNGAQHIGILWNLKNKLGISEFCIESAGYQISLVQTAINQGLPARKIPADGNKTTRALPAAALFEQHKIFFLNTLDHLADIENELVSFPSGKHDDIVDNFGYGAIRRNEISQYLYNPDSSPGKDYESLRDNRLSKYNNLK